MDPTKLTVKAQEALATAAERARVTGNPELTPLHLLAGLLAEQGSVAESLLRGVGADVEALRRDADDALGRLPSMQGAQTAPQAKAAGMGRMPLATGWGACSLTATSIGGVVWWPGSAALRNTRSITCSALSSQ